MFLIFKVGDEKHVSNRVISLKLQYQFRPVSKNLMFIIVSLTIMPDLQCTYVTKGILRPSIEILVC